MLGGTFSELKAQIVVDNLLTPQQLIQDVLVGSGVVITNVNYTGNPLSIGRFNNAQSLIGMDSGVVMGSGFVTTIVNPPGITSSDPTCVTCSDPQLAAIVAPQLIRDAAVLSFDFSSDADTVLFRYVFASEEYPNFAPPVNPNGINDVFGFFVTGLNPSGPAFVNFNIAVIPNTSTPVTIANVNPAFNSSFFVPNFGANANTNFVFGGYTVILTAKVAVIPCLTYNLKLAIGDASDQILDSGVFLEAKSFTANIPTMNLDFTNPQVVDTNAIEGCKNAKVVFQLPSPATQDVVVPIALTGSATNGVDYIFVPDSIIIFAGNDTASLTIVPIADGIVEGDETVFVTVMSSLCAPNFINFLIKDYNIPVFEISNDTTICQGDTLTLSSVVTGGLLNYSYLWSTGDTTSSIFITANGDSTYSIISRDGCGTADTSNIIVTVDSFYLPHFEALDPFCENAPVNVTYNGNATPTSTFNWDFGTGTIVSGSGIGPYQISFPAGTTQIGLSVTDNGCTSNDSIIPLLINSPPMVELGDDLEICAFDSVIISPGPDFVGYQWNTGATTSSIKIGSVGTYAVEVVDTNGCANSDSMAILTIFPLPDERLPEDTLICEGDTLIFEFSNNTSIYTWNNGAFTGNQFIATSPGIVYLNVENEFGCTFEDSIVLNEQCVPIFYFPNAFTPNLNNLNDVFGPKGIRIQAFEMQIFNRWGELVFETNSILNLWDGTFKGEPAPPGNYTYVAIVTGKVGGGPRTYPVSGNVQLIR